MFVSFFCNVWEMRFSELYHMPSGGLALLKYKARDLYLRRRTAAVRATSPGRSKPSVGPQSLPESATCGRAPSVRKRSASRADKSGAAKTSHRNINICKTHTAPEESLHTHSERLWAAGTRGVWMLRAVKHEHLFPVRREILSSCRFMASAILDDTNVLKENGRKMELVFFTTMSYSWFKATLFQGCVGLWKNMIQLNK